MPWGLWASPTTNSGKDEGKSSPPPSTNSSTTTTPPPSANNSNHGVHSISSNPFSSSTRLSERAPPAGLTDVPPIPPQLKKKAISWNDSLWMLIDWQHYQEPRSIVLYTLPTIGAFALFGIWRSFLRRFRGTAYISPGFFRRRTLLGKVTSVGDGDGFHFFHTPGGRLAGWGWLRRVPTARKQLRDRTIPIRIAGIDAPEGAHFGRPAQPYSKEALEWLRSYILGKRVWARIHRKDQYDRVVATVFVRKPPFFLRKDVGLEMLKQGLATTYEAKSGAEFGGPKMEQVYKNAEAAARRKGTGMWANTLTGFFGLGRRREIESPRQYKDRMRAAGNTILEKPKATSASKKTTAVKKETAAAKKKDTAAAKKEKAKTAADSAAAKKV
ncbi:nuclease domain-protein [Pseudoneurospora amorphoporcata]|uniref:Probable endonuclease LCL3 n=1 Tax=Pseudoneurospora amorphoporcata TaxID=241081 RepID=A0AAN6NVX1_9PEZI|nr:nuclease domain-protein [Pseudoneurospora amorphoporcata]